MKNKMYRAFMAKKSLFIFLLMLPTMMMAQSKVAVYMIAPEIDSDVREIVGRELAAVLDQDEAFIASDKTADLESIVPNNQDNTQICLSGLSLGLDYICVTTIEKYNNTNFVAVQLLEVKTGELKARFGEASQLASINDILNLAATLADQIRNSLGSNK